MGWTGQGSKPGGGEARLSAPVRTGPGAHPAYYTMGTGSFPGVKRQRRGVDHPPLSSTEVKERVELYLYFPSEPSWSVLGFPSRVSFITGNTRYNHSKGQLTNAVQLRNQYECTLSKKHFRHYRV